MISANFSNTAVGVNPGACNNRRCFSVTCYRFVGVIAPPVPDVIPVAVREEQREEQREEPSGKTSGKIQFGVYELDREAGELRKHGVLIRLPEQPLQVLLALVERPGQVVTREEIRQRIWGQDTFVDFEHSLNKAVNRLREALCDDAAQPRYIETIPRRGHRFVAPVTGNVATEEREAPSRADSGSAGKRGQHTTQPSKRLALLTAGMVIAIAIAGVMWFKKPRKATPQEARHMTSAGFAPVLSRDGKLLAYLSILGGPTHIWVLVR